MNILHLSAVRNWGGGEKHIENLCLELAESNPEVNNIILCKKGDLFEKSLERSKLTYTTAPILTNFDLRYVIKLITLVKEKKIDIIHIHDPTALAFAVISDKFIALPPFIFSKKTSFPIRDRKRTLYKYNYPKIKKILCVSEKSKSVIAEHINEPSKLIKIYHGFRSEREQFKNTREELLAELNIPKEKTIIGNIANHIWPKDLETFLKVAHHLVYTKNRKDLYFVQIGFYFRETPHLLKKLKELKLENHVKCYGFKNNASRFFKVFNYFLLTSKMEGLPNVIYEAFYHKVPVIATNVGGIPEIVTHMENGLLANTFDAEKLAEHILFLEKNHELISRFTKNGYKNLVENFTTKQMAQQTLQEYKNVLYGRY
ncbi:glycosyltransferase family 4 protein [Salegentibacter salegens]|uniref:Glycosyltransferase involved in cell wall bisynthesis n=1 Tax=Salegentibacter salegens TaxID=143223 RepID=A0A1M7NW14_9FLAO|nr:glycosyltransferase family 4 protein [Salegentibacter salegens]PRX45753.1 glycosyltransferase involved in cell wall biosynthesis [Salegentibacter salegens]SHN08274.1 Glycosyltransferase involved in cell wall bisynthesis [Salegentibacter salegens]